MSEFLLNQCDSTFAPKQVTVNSPRKRLIIRPLQQEIYNFRTETAAERMQPCAENHIRSLTESPRNSLTRQRARANRNNAPYEKHKLFSEIPDGKFLNEPEEDSNPRGFGKVQVTEVFS